MKPSVCLLAAFLFFNDSLTVIGLGLYWDTLLMRILAFHIQRDLDTLFFSLAFAVFAVSFILCYKCRRLLQSPGLDSAIILNCLYLVWPSAAVPDGGLSELEPRPTPASCFLVFPKLAPVAMYRSDENITSISQQP
jgi:hypothetical protein